MTRGEYLVGVDFNPGQDENVKHAKAYAARWIDWMENYSQRDNLPAEAKELIRIAERAVEKACMYTVKAVTKPART